MFSLGPPGIRCENEGEVDITITKIGTEIQRIRDNDNQDIIPSSANPRRCIAVLRNSHLSALIFTELQSLSLGLRVQLSNSSVLYAGQR